MNKIQAQKIAIYCRIVPSFWHDEETLRFIPIKLSVFNINILPATHRSILLGLLKQKNTNNISLVLIIAYNMYSLICILYEFGCYLNAF